jgi:hypothetical protein
MGARDHLVIRNDPEWNITVDEILAEHREEVLNATAEKITIREATPLWGAVNNILLAYGFFNPVNSVSETERIFALFREYLAELAAQKGN